MMGDKKRKSLNTGSELPMKKSKLSADAEYKPADNSRQTAPTAKPPNVTATNEPTPNTPKPSTAVSKKSRKRAADFLSDDEPDEPATPATLSKDVLPSGDAQDSASIKKRKKREKKKAKKAAGTAAEFLTADGVNGVIERKSSAALETNSATKPAAQTMQAEANRTVDQELEDDFGGFGDADEEDDTKKDDKDSKGVDDEDGAALLAGFDTDSSDVEDEGFDESKMPPIPNYKQTQKKLRKAKESNHYQEPGIVYIGRIPHGFYEEQMRNYFSQFGDILRLRLSRNKRTGASKHFAFIEFASQEVAKIVADTMDNYLMFEHILKCKFAPAETLHPDLWKGANKKFRKIPHDKIEREKLAAPKSVDQWTKKNEREQKRRDKKAKKLKETMGYEMPQVALKDPKKAVRQKKLLEQKDGEGVVKQIENGVAAGSKGTLAAIEGTKEAAIETNGEVKDVEEPSKKSKKGKKKEKKAKADVEVATAGVASEVHGVAVPAEKEREPEPAQEPATATNAKVASENKDKTPLTSEPTIKKKYIPPTHKKQQLKAEIARKHPEIKQEKKRQEAEEKKQRRAAKVARRHEKRTQEIVEKSANNDGKDQKGGAAAGARSKIKFDD